MRRARRSAAKTGPAKRLYHFSYCCLAFAINFSISKTCEWGTRFRWYLLVITSWRLSRSSSSIAEKSVHSVSVFNLDRSCHLPPCRVAVTNRVSPSSVFSRHSCFFILLTTFDLQSRPGALPVNILNNFSCSICLSCWE